jgi:hypothetical protein
MHLAAQASIENLSVCAYGARIFFGHMTQSLFDY